MCQIITLAYHSLIPDVEIFQEFSRSIRGLPIAINHQFLMFFCNEKATPLQIKLPTANSLHFQLLLCQQEREFFSNMFYHLLIACALIFLSSFPFAFSCPLTNDDSWMLFAVGKHLIYTLVKTAMSFEMTFFLQLFSTVQRKISTLW